MFITTVLVLPLPLRFRKQSLKTYEFLFSSREVKTSVYISLTLVGLLFIDSFQKNFKFKTSNTYDPRYLQSSYNQTPDVMARIFYNQRNLYISGAVLFFGIAIPTVFNIIRRLIKYEEFNLEKTSKEVRDAKVKELNDELTKKEQDIETFKKQKKSLEKAYDELSEKLNKTSGVVTDKKSD
ncbi:Endoplasmic reticulum transmembrane protein 1 [Wickerhamomyces ciferrii]|uniref:Endoplasmic reticulum transmembrane protein n=1 Tax=Wickerhamomyces ciferrii (strain ATCC 14091 / BCRC 22168 / CBS 111 / JCM 3599 / NBRC 0793 / NRRL Y-1031 F-60-10) TaxID=1206466 RepID=K0KLP8_WICCF|nr:Endoplasmic reticulum transmembrane protein 1 [Wickerhamomyces ciferrii]CCH46190.1 Endoplasmic reticulum transmembrane protein 1 [Wickerhamomyces ciferrii]